MGTRDVFTSVGQLENKQNLLLAVLKAHLIERVSLLEMEGPACDAQMVDLILGFSHFEMEGYLLVMLRWKSQFQTCTSVLLRVLRLPIKQCSSSTTDRSNDGAIPGKSAFTVDVADDKGYG
ncbi:hypothetical protein POTOM_025905 [Populus tomentosa]|uniref:Uncharacterized protein n=1 Tax=Populus tomentosa TaxID=118781 RepID=A0A8X7ZW78_POPTO|nr:hypothetical protein POTOM_025905 [Populus tomentosa]